MSDESVPRSGPTLKDWLAESPARDALIFAHDPQQARVVAERLRLPPSRWRFVHTVEQIRGLSPLQLATVTVAGFATKNPSGMEALKALHSMAKVYNVQVPSFEPV